MVAVDAELLRLIDSRVLAYQQQPIAMGTCVSRDASGSMAMVTFDPDPTPMPVKVGAGVHVFPTDRVLMLRVLGATHRQPDLYRDSAPGEWVVVQGFTRHTGTGNHTSIHGRCVNTNTALQTFAANPDIPTIDFRKLYDDTDVRMWLFCGAFCDTVNLQSEWAVQINGVDYVTGGLNHSTTGHFPPIGGITDATGIPAGTYTCTARWRKANAAGAPLLGVNAGDWYTFGVEEIAPPTPPA